MVSPVQCHDVLDAIELHGLSPLPEPVREHLSDCRNCQGIVSDFESIVSAAHELPAEVEPPARIWISLRSQLLAEGVIREEAASETVPAEISDPRASWWHGFSTLLQGRALAIAAVGLLLIAAAVFQLRHAGTPPAPTARTQPDRQVVPTNINPPQPMVAESQLPQRSANEVLHASSVALNNQERELHTARPASTLASSSPVDDSLQQDLVTLDAFIADCEQHLQANPEDQLAKQYLAAAYQQKAELLAVMLDRGRSVN